MLHSCLNDLKEKGIQQMYVGKEGEERLPSCVAAGSMSCSILVVSNPPVAADPEADPHIHIGNYIGNTSQLICHAFHEPRALFRLEGRPCVVY